MFPTTIHSFLSFLVVIIYCGFTGTSGRTRSVEVVGSPALPILFLFHSNSLRNVFTFYYSLVCDTPKSIGPAIHSFRLPESFWDWMRGANGTGGTGGMTDIITMIGLISVLVTKEALRKGEAERFYINI